MMVGGIFVQESEIPFFICYTAILNTNFFVTFPISSNSTEIFRDLRPSWDVLPIYEMPHPPGLKCIGENDDLYYPDNLNHVPMKMNGSRVLFEISSLGSLSFSDITYKLNHNRLLCENDYRLYTITASGVFLLR
ncbi:MAG: hypothetical protein EAX90_15205 [Candidatus Heimdallarchaeota archaeon]|nr:hypothetical protein [Candidatus Heimdallarchaeota archaeon]